MKLEKQQARMIGQYKVVTIFVVFFFFNFDQILVMFQSLVTSKLFRLLKNLHISFWDQNALIVLVSYMACILVETLELQCYVHAG
jgi:sulfur relay (sulfurtransferase) DsrF/TusC family protein